MPAHRSSSFHPSSRLLTCWLLARSRQAAPLNAAPISEQGLTLIECLVAIVVVAITVVTITPPIFLATASRVQARRAEQANQIAQSEVDRIRGIVERGNFQLADLPPIGVASGIEGTPVGTTVATGTILSPGNCANKYPTTPLANATTLVPVDVNGDCQPEFAMQVFRTQGCFVGDATPPATPSSFGLGVRVYAYNPNEGTLPTLEKERTTLGVTAGRKDQGGNLRRPLQVLYSSASTTGSAKVRECVAFDTPQLQPSPSPTP